MTPAFLGGKSRHVKQQARLAAVLLGCACIAAPRGTSAAADPDAERRSTVVARVGAHQLTVGDVESRLSEVPPFQLRLFGATEDAARNKFLSDVLVPDLLLARDAEERALAKGPAVAMQLARARSNAALRNVRGKLTRSADVPDAAVRAYYDSHKMRFDTPTRIQVYRILCQNKDEAQAVLAQARKDPTYKSFGDLARDKSIDKATYLRAGNLGFLGPDGASNEAGVRVDPQVVRAAEKVKDGEFVPEPVAEGPNWAVVWRRGSVPESKRPVAEVAPLIRDLIFRERAEAAQKALIDDLRRANLKESHPELLPLIEIKFDDPALGPQRNFRKDGG
jgi:peptidyl-prolyl cis-trans isomerase C